MSKRLSQDEYVQKKGNYCPFCGACEFEGHEITVEAGKAFQEVTCNECGKGWYDIYQLVSYEEAE